MSRVQGALRISRLLDMLHEPPLGLACTVPETVGDDGQGRVGQGVMRDERIRRLW